MTQQHAVQPIGLERLPGLRRAVEIARHLLADLPCDSPAFQLRQGEFVTGVDIAALHEEATDMIATRQPNLTVHVNQDIYLERWFLERPSTAAGHSTTAAYLHRFRSHDIEVPHDHPWASVAFALAGQLGENYFPNGADRPPARWTVRRGAVVYRPPLQIHALQRIPETGDPGRRSDPITLFVTGPSVRRWGFWVKQPDGRHRYIPEEQYHAEHRASRRARA